MTSWFDSVRTWRKAGGTGKVVRGSPQYDEVAAIHAANNPGWEPKAPRPKKSRDEQIAKLRNQLSKLGLEVSPDGGPELVETAAQQNMGDEDNSPAVSAAERLEGGSILGQTESPVATTADLLVTPPVTDSGERPPFTGGDLDNFIDHLYDECSERTPQKERDSLNDFPIMMGSGIFTRAMKRFMSERQNTRRKARQADAK